jgi:hypothetical protein
VADDWPTKIIVFSSDENMDVSSSAHVADEKNITIFVGFSGRRLADENKCLIFVGHLADENTGSCLKKTVACILILNPTAP